MDTTNTIENFFARAVANDFSRDISFRIMSISLSNGLTLNENDLVYAKSGTLPARAIGNVEAKYAGLTFNLPGTVSFPSSDSYEIDFYCSEKSELRNLLLLESRRTFNELTGIAGAGNQGGVIAGPDSTITLVQLDKKLDVISKFTLYGVSIRNVGALDFSISEGTGTVLSFKTTLAYHFFVQEEGVVTAGKGV